MTLHKQHPILTQAIQDAFAGEEHTLTEGLVTVTQQHISSPVVVAAYVGKDTLKAEFEIVAPEGYEAGFKEKVWAYIHDARSSKPTMA